jgi:hypothetical protein
MSELVRAFGFTPSNVVIVSDDAPATSRQVARAAARGKSRGDYRQTVVFPRPEFSWASFLLLHASDSVFAERRTTTHHHQNIMDSYMSEVVRTFGFTPSKVVIVSDNAPATRQVARDAGRRKSRGEWLVSGLCRRRAAQRIV